MQQFPISSFTINPNYNFPTVFVLLISLKVFDTTTITFVSAVTKTSEPSLSSSPLIIDESSTTNSSTVDWQSIRSESRRYEIYNFCKTHFEAGRDLCDKSILRETARSSANQDFYPENCHCEDNCFHFDDCCIDKAYSFKLSNTTSRNFYSINNKNGQPWSCVDLPISLHGLYAYKQCLPAYHSTDIELLCMSEPRSFLQWLPAYSLESGIFYRNMFCAFCNSDHNKLYEWNLTVSCDHDTSQVDISPYINEKHFNYSTGLWEFVVPDQMRNIVMMTMISNTQSWSIDNKWRCKPSLPELERQDSRSKFGTRSCQPVIDSCAIDWTDSIVSAKCAAYTFLVGLPATKTIYKNTFCARCNNLAKSDLRRLECDLDKMSGPARSPTSFSYVSLRQLFDVSRYSSCSLTQSLIYNPATESCVLVRCNDGYTINPETGRCESETQSKEGTLLRTDCLRIFYNSSDYMVQADGSILLGSAAPTVQTLLKLDAYQNYTRIDSTTGFKIEGILTCFDEHQSHYSLPSYIQGTLSIVTSILSILGLTGYLTVTCLVPKLRNLRAWMVMSLAGALLAANVTMIFSHLASPTVTESDSDSIFLNTRGSLFCVITAINLHYWYLASFAWMNVMAYDAWKSFKRTHERLSSSMAHFLKYSLYSWLLPFPVVLVSSIFDISNISFDWRPRYGHSICWISQRKPLLAFFVVPVATIILINGILFSLTTYYLYRTKKSLQPVINSRSKSENSQNYPIYVRLATLMGATWISWFIAAFSGINFLWYLFIVLNGLQGVFIFFYFTWKKEVFKALRERIGFLVHGHEVVSGSSLSNTKLSGSLLPQSSSTNF